MKRALFAVLFILFSFSGFAQKIRFSDTSNKWTIYWFNEDFVALGTFTESYSTDTVVIAGVTYQKLANANTLIREDTMLRKVYAIKHDDTTFTEQLLYDYTLQVGDTFRCQVAVHHVSSIDSVLINSIWHRIWYLKADSTIGAGVGWLVSDYFVIEGIGCVTVPTTPLWPLYFEGGEALTCFKNNGIAPPLTHKVGSIFDNTSSCSSTFGLAVENVPIKTDGIVIFPNPATKELTISSINKITAVVISNEIGQVVYSNNYRSPKVQVDVSGLPAGVYFVRVNGTDMRKFVKE